MSLIGSIAISMTTNIEKLTKGFKSASSQVLGFATSLKGIALAGVGGYGFFELIKLAGDQEAALNKVKFAFGDFAKTVTDQSEKMNMAFGFSREEFNKSAASLGSLLKSEGYTESAAATLSTQFATLAEKMSRMKGIAVEDVIEKIGKGLTGKAKGLTELGIVISKDAVEVEAFRLGLMRMGGALSDSAKQQATASLMYSELQKKTAHYGETVDSIQGRMAAFKDRVEEIAQSFAVMLMPLIGPGGAVQEGLAVLQVAMDNWGATATNAGNNVVRSFEGQTQQIGILQRSIGYIADGWQLLKIGFLSAQTAITFGIKKIVDGFAFLAGGLDKFFNFLASHGIGASTGKESSITSFLNALSDNLDDLNKKQFDTLQQKVQEPWAHDKVDSFFENVREKMKATRAELNKSVDVSKALGDKKGVMPLQKEYQLAKASAFGEKDTANTLLRSAYGRGGASNKDSAKIAANTNKANSHLEKIANAVARNEQVFATIWNNF